MCVVDLVVDGQKLSAVARRRLQQNGAPAQNLGGRAAAPELGGSLKGTPVSKDDLNASDTGREHTELEDDNQFSTLVEASAVSFSASREVEELSRGSMRIRLSSGQVRYCCCDVGNPAKRFRNLLCRAPAYSGSSKELFQRVVESSRRRQRPIVFMRRLRILYQSSKPLPHLRKYSCSPWMMAFKPCLSSASGISGPLLVSNSPDLCTMCETTLSRQAPIQRNVPTSWTLVLGRHSSLKSQRPSPTFQAESLSVGKGLQAYPTWYSAW
jgi:hypothetical protein